MKNILKLFLGLLIIGSVGTSCSDADNAVDQLFNDVDTSGAILRTLERPADLITLTGDNNSIDITIEVQEGNGQTPSTFTEVRAYVQVFSDQDLLIPLLDANGNDIVETLHTTINASEFGVSEINGLPETTISMSSASIVAIFDGTDFPVPTFISTRLEVELADGRVFSNNQVTATVATGSYFASPFLYKTIFINN